MIWRLIRPSKIFWSKKLLSKRMFTQILYLKVLWIWLWMPNEMILKHKIIYKNYKQVKLSLKIRLLTINSYSILRIVFLYRQIRRFETRFYHYIMMTHYRDTLVETVPNHWWNGNSIGPECKCLFMSTPRTVRHVKGLSPKLIGPMANWKHSPCQIIYLRN